MEEKQKDEQEVEIDLDLTADVVQLDVSADVVQPLGSSDSDSDDLLKTIEDKHVSKKLGDADEILDEEDSPSHILPVPTHLQDQITPSSTQPYVVTERDPSLMTPQETAEHLA